MKRILAILALLWLAPAYATIYYIRDCGTGAEGTCTAGSDAAAGTSDANAWQACSKVKTQFSSVVAGDRFRFAKGAAWNDCDLNFLPARGTDKDNPIVFESYDPATGGTNRPKLTRTAGTLLNFVDSGASDHDEGYLVQGLHLIGSTAANQNVEGTGINVGQDADYVVIDDVVVEGFFVGIRCNGGTTASSANSGDYLTDNFIVRNSNIHHNYSQGLELSCGDMLVENNIVDRNGANAGDHNFYYDDRGTGVGLGQIAYPINQIVLRGNTITNNTPYISALIASVDTGTDTITATAHRLIADEPVALWTPGGTIMGGLTEHLVYYVVGGTLTANTVQVSAAPGGAAIDLTSAGTGNRYVTARTVRVGDCKATSVVMHGEKTGIIFENNIIREDDLPVTATAPSCWGIGIDSGRYSAGPYQHEGFNAAVVRGNTLINYPISISLDICRNCIIESNNLYTATSNNTYGVKHRGKEYEWTSEYIDDDYSDNVTIRSNTVYIAAPDQYSIGIWSARHASDTFTATTGLRIESNLVHFGSGSTSATMCFNTQNFLTAQFTGFDNNLCNFAGTQGVWMKDGTTASPTTKTLAQWRSATGFDMNSIVSNNAANTIFSVTPASGNNFSLATITTSPSKNVGHPTQSSPWAIFGITRGSADATPDIGAFEFGQGSNPAPPAPTRVCNGAVC